MASSYYGISDLVWSVQMATVNFQFGKLLPFTVEPNLQSAHFTVIFD